MAPVWQNQAYARAAGQAEIDAGLRSYMLSIYNYMTVGLLITGVVAFFTAQSNELMYTIYSTPLKWVVFLAPLGFVFFLSARIESMAPSTARSVFFVYAAVMGLSLAAIFRIYTGASIAQTFFVTAGTFGATSLYGYTTRTDLSRFGSFLVMGLIGLVIASVVNIFMASSALQFAISVIGVLLFTGLTAWDTQRLKEAYVSSYGVDAVARLAVMGALTLYLDFINLFMFMLRFLGVGRSND